MTRARAWCRLAAGLCLGGWLILPAAAQSPSAPQASATESATSRNGREIYDAFRAGLAEPECKDSDASPRWRQHFANVPRRMAADNDDVLPLFGFVVDALREASVPTEFALIPFVESGYKPGARSPSGPAGLWQLIAITARNHGVPMRPGYDGRLSAVDSTRAAVRYLKTLYGMFAGDWRLAGMAYNAGEYRVLSALKQSGQTARNADPEKLSGVPELTRSYVRKLHALSCLIEQADDREEWLRALDRPVPRLQAVTLPVGIDRIDQWALRTEQDAEQLRRLNPVFVDGRISAAGGKPARLLATLESDRAIDTYARATAPDAPSRAIATVATAAAPVGAATATATTATASAPPAPRRHQVGRGETAWTIARRYDIRVDDLMARNGLSRTAVLRPGQQLLIDADVSASRIPDAAGSP